MDYIPKLPWWGWLAVLLILVMLILPMMGIIPWTGLAYFALVMVAIAVGVPALGLVIIGAWMGEQNIFGKEAKPRTIIQVAIFLASGPIFMAFWLLGVDLLWAIGVALAIPAIIFVGIGVWVLYDHRYAVKESKYAKSPAKKPTAKT